MTDFESIINQFEQTINETRNANISINYRKAKKEWIVTILNVRPTKKFNDKTIVKAMQLAIDFIKKERRKRNVAIQPYVLQP